MESALNLKITPHEGLRDGLQPETACSSKSWLCPGVIQDKNLIFGTFSTAGIEY